MALFPKFLNKSPAPKDAAERGEREYFKAASDKPQAAVARPEEKELLRLIAIDACRQSHLHNQLRTCQVVGGERGKGYTLLMKLHSEIDLTEAQLIKRIQTVERRCGVVAHSRNVLLSDIYWAMPATMLRTPDRVAESARVASPSSSFSASQFQDFSPSQIGGASAFYPDASLIPWSDEDLLDGPVRIKKAAPGPTGGRRINPPPAPNETGGGSLFGINNGKKTDRD